MIPFLSGCAAEGRVMFAGIICQSLIAYSTADTAMALTMTATRLSEVRKLKGLKNISWLTNRQLNKVAGALSVNVTEKRGQIFDERDGWTAAIYYYPEWRASPAVTVKAGALWWSCWRPE